MIYKILPRLSNAQLGLPDTSLPTAYNVWMGVLDFRTADTDTMYSKTVSVYNISAAL